jgi:hypothetical protein
MAVTSEKLLDFVVKAAATEINLDANGEVITHIPAVLTGDALASALKQVIDLSCHESGIAFAQRQWDDTHAQQVPTFSGPRPVN